MFIQKSLTLDSIVSFDWQNLLQRCLNQLFAAVLAIMFIESKSVYCCMLFALVMIYNILNFKIKLAGNSSPRDAMNQNAAFRIQCQNREKVIFQAIFYLSLGFLLFKLSKILLSPLSKYAFEADDDTLREIIDFHERLSYLLWMSPQFYFSDLWCQVILTLTSYFFYSMNEGLTVYYDLYTVEIYKKVFNRSTKYFSLALALTLLLFKEVVFFRFNILGVIENVVIFVIMVKVFFKVKVGNYKSLKKYIIVLKYVAVAKLALFLTITIFTKTFNNEVHNFFFRYLFSEVDSYMHPRGSKLPTLVVLYYLYNLTCFSMKFQEHFVVAESSQLFGTLQSKPYKLFFISYFAKYLLSILKITDIKAAVKHNFELRYEFYQKLKKYTYFKKAFEYHFRSSGLTATVSRKYGLYEIWYKYYNVFDIYKFDVLAITLNCLMVFFLAGPIFQVNLLSIFYLALALIIMISTNLKVIWHATITFCIIPSLLVLLLFTQAYIAKVLHYGRLQGSIEVFLMNMGFGQSLLSVQETLHGLLLLLFTSMAFIISLTYIKSKSGGIKQNYTIIENLRSRRMMIIDADEDILFLFSSSCRFAILLTKFLVIFVICKECLSYINVTNTFILVGAAVCLSYSSDSTFSLFINIIMTVFVARFFARFKVIFGRLEETDILLYGLYFNSSVISSGKAISTILTEQETMFYINYGLLCSLFLIQTLLSKTESTMFLQNKNFKTRFLSLAYNYFVDLLKHSKNVIDSTKMFFVYFVIFYFCIYDIKDQLSCIEFYYTNFILVCHMVLFKKQGNVKSWLFFGLFIAYFAFILGRLTIEYRRRFELYSSLGSSEITDLQSFIQNYNLNYRILFPYAIKVLISIVSLNSIYAELSTPSFKDAPTLTHSATANNAKSKVYYMFLKVLSVFLKEILLFYTSFRFLQKPNIFKLLYLMCYMHYFTSQIKSLSRIFDKFKFFQIVRAKIHYYQHVVLNTKFANRFVHRDLDLNDSFFEDLNIAYFRLFSKTIFNKIHKKVNTTWIWMFGFVSLYLQIVFALAYFGRFMDAKLPYFLLYNLNAYGTDDIRSEFFQVVLVLFITVFELYFIDILKSRRVGSEKELARSISLAIFNRYRYFIKDLDIQPDFAEGAGNVTAWNVVDFVNVMNDLQTTELKEEDFEFQKLRTPAVENEQRAFITSANDQQRAFVTNLNRELSPMEKHILFNHNRSKLSFLQVVLGFLAFLQRMLVLPLIIGVLLRKSAPFAMTLITLVFLLYSKYDYFKVLNNVNKALAFVFLAEYMFIFYFETPELSENSATNLLEAKAVQFRGDLLSGLPFVFLYTALIKGFYMVLILLCKFSLVEVDKVCQQIFAEVKHRYIDGVAYWILDYEHWGRDKYFFFHQLKKLCLMTLADIFFIISLLAYYHTSGVVVYLVLLFLMAFKLYFTFYLKKPFGQSAYPEYLVYFKILSYLNVFVAITHQILAKASVYNTSVTGGVLLSITIILNFVIMDCINSPTCQIEKAKTERYYWIRNKLGILGLVYVRNEKNILETVDLEVKNQYLKAKYRSHQHSSKNSSPIIPYEFSQETLYTLSLYSSKKSYREFLLGNLNFAERIVMSVKLWLRRKLLETNSASTNLLSLYSNYIYKNQAFIADDYELDIIKLQQGDSSEIDNLMQAVEEAKATKFKSVEKCFASTVKNKIQDVEQPMALIRNRNTTVGPLSPTKLGASLTVLANANLYLIKELTVDRMGHQLQAVSNRRFSEGLYKYMVGDSQCLILRNFDQVSAKLNDQHVDFNISEYIKWVIFLLWVRFELIMNLLLICLLCFGQGFISTVYIFILIFLVLIESRVKNFKKWQMFYLVFILNFAIQLFLHNWYDLVEYENPISEDGLNLPPQSIVGLALFLYGKTDQAFLLMIFIFIELTLMHLCDNFRWEKTYLEVENYAQAIYRVTFHKKSWQSVFNRSNNIIISEINIMEKALKKKFKQTLKEREYTIFLVNLIKRKSAIYKGYKEKLAVFLVYLGKIIPNYTQDMASLRPKFFKDYFWRNFAYQLRKCGRNYYTYQLMTLIAIMAYFLVFFFKMQSVDKTVMDIFRNNEIHGTLSLNVSLLFLVICLERYIYSRMSLYWASCTDSERDIGLRHIKFMINDASQYKVMPINRLEKLKQLARRCIALIRWRAPRKVSATSSYKFNPMLPKFYLAVAIWAYISFLAIIWVPLVSNQQLTGGFAKKIFCNETYKTLTNPRNPTSTCNSFANNIYLQVLFLLGNVYLITAVAQIRRGNSPSYRYKQVDYRKPKEIVRFYFYKYTPYIRELKTIIDYMASQTSLSLFHWLRVEDIETTIITAQLNEASNKYTGNRLGKILKRVIGLSFLGLFVLLLVAPLYMFSDVLPNNIIDEVKSADISVMFQVTSGTYFLYKNTGYTIEALSNYNKWFERVRQQDRLKKFDSNLFRKLAFGSSSESSLDITHEMANLIKDTYKQTHMLKIIISLNMQTSYRGAVSVQFDFNLDDDNAAIFLSMISSKACADTSKNRMVLGSSPKLIDLKNLAQSPKSSKPQDILDFENTYVFSFTCEKNTSKVLFELSDEDSDKIEFLVLSDTIKNSVDLLERLTASQVSLLSIYAIIFSYIGLTIVRKAFFDQAHTIWTTEMPDARKLQEYIHMITFARQQGDLVSEGKFFHKLIDLYRAPEKIKKLTGPLYNPKNLRKPKT